MVGVKPCVALMTFIHRNGHEPSCLVGVAVAHFSPFTWRYIQFFSMFPSTLEALTENFLDFPVRTKQPYDVEEMQPDPLTPFCP